MKTLDTFSKRLLIIAVSISMVLLSASAFVLTMQSATAKSEPKMQGLPIIGLGVDTGKGMGYYMQLGLDGYPLKVSTIALPQ